MYDIVSNASIDMGWLIFDNYMHSVRSPIAGIFYPLLVVALCSLSWVRWAADTEIGFAMKVIKKGLIEELKLQNAKKRYHVAAVASLSS